MAASESHSTSALARLAAQPDAHVVHYEPRQCQALDEHPTEVCSVRPTWVLRIEGVQGEWLVCQPHLALAIMQLDELYGTQVVVDRA